MFQLYNDDCINVLKTMANNSVHLTLTDIPYDEVNRTSNGLRVLDKNKADILGDINLAALTNEIIRVTSGTVYMFCGINQISSIREIMSENGLSTRLGIWEKSNPSPMNGQHLWLSGVEACVYGKKKNATFNEHCKNPVWRYPSGQSNIHPTQKPLDLFRQLMEASSNRGDIVFDPFMGSGTTGVAAKQLGREFIGVELNLEFFNICQKRIQEETIALDSDLFQW